MCRFQLPRVYELRDLIDDPSNPSAYFQEFDVSLRDPICGAHKKQVWLAREREFQRLDPESWCLLKEEARRYLSALDGRGRGWEQLINILNQARAHNYLKDLGCSQVEFIQVGKGIQAKAPDLKAELNGQKVLCEMKTINPSQSEIERRYEAGVGSTTDFLDNAFLCKLDKTIEYAKIQLDRYDAGESAKRIVFLVVNFDDRLGECKDSYYRQIDSHLAVSPIRGIEIVFFNQCTAFHADISMVNAQVINE
jgi:hypothetical protein